MRVSLDTQLGGVVDDTTREDLLDLRRVLETQTATVGNRLKFRPTKYALDLLVERRATFAPECRTAWGHFYKKQRDPKRVDYTPKTAFYPHQERLFPHVCDREWFAFEWEMGLGKTKIALDVAAYKYAKGEIDAVLVVTLKGVHRAWVTIEAPRHLAVDWHGGYWNSGRVRGGMDGVIEARDKLALAALNFDVIHRKAGFEYARRFLTTRKVMLIVDESQYAKTPAAETTKALHKLADKAVCRFNMTGTPYPNGPLDAWAQFTFLSPLILRNKNFFAFRTRYAKMVEMPGVTTSKGRPVKVVDGYRNLAELKETLDPHRDRLLKIDVLDLPEKMPPVPFPFEMSEEQWRIYKQLSKKLLIEIESKRVSADRAVLLWLRLQQVACGFVIPDEAVGLPDAASHAIRIKGPTPRLDMLRHVIEQTSGAAIIWGVYRPVLEDVVTVLREGYDDAEIGVYAGGMSDDAAAQLIDDFQAGKKRWLVNQMQKGATGLTLTAAASSIYAQNSPNLALRLQSEDRTHRIGQTQPCTYSDIFAASTVEEKLIEGLIAKNELACALTGDRLREWLRTK